MTWLVMLNFGLLLFAVCRPASAHDLLPAGSIKDALSAGKYAVLFEDDPPIQQYVKAFRDRDFPTAELIGEKRAATDSFAERSVIVFGTPAHAWLRKHRDVLPFKFQEDSVAIDGRQFQGKHLRVICAMRNPDNPNHRAVVWAAARDPDVLNLNEDLLSNINSNNILLYGFAEWIVLDGKQALAAGSFRSLRLAPAKMVADLEEITAKIKSVHPAAVNRIPPEVETAIRTARAELSKPVSRDRFSLVLSRVLHSLHDAHSMLYLLPAVEWLDVPFTWIGDGMIVTADAGGLRKGDRLLRIGTRTDVEILGLLRKVIPSENEQWVRHRAEQLLRDVDFLRSIGIAKKAPVPVTVERSGREIKLGVPMGAAVRLSAVPGGNVPPVRFDLDPGNDLGVLVVDTCTNDDSFKKTLKQFFDGVREKKISRIAVDVRRNGGGDSRAIDEFLRYIDVEHYSSFGWVAKNARVKDPFRRKVFVLTSKATFSSGNWFAVILQDNKIGTVLGEPTGNAPTSYGHTPGSLQLSHSALSYQLSHKHWRRPDPQRDPADCVTPDLMIVTTRRHIIEGIDPVLEHLRNVR